jgi:hypothetical protein
MNIDAKTLMAGRNKNTTPLILRSMPANKPILAINLIAHIITLRRIGGSLYLSSSELFQKIEEVQILHLLGPQCVTNSMVSI